MANICYSQITKVLANSPKFSEIEDLQIRQDITSSERAKTGKSLNYLDNVKSEYRGMITESNFMTFDDWGGIGKAVLLSFFMPLIFFAR